MPRAETIERNNHAEQVAELPALPVRRNATSTRGEPEDVAVGDVVFYDGANHQIVEMFNENGAFKVRLEDENHGVRVVSYSHLVSNAVWESYGNGTIDSGEDDGDTDTRTVFEQDAHTATRLLIMFNDRAVEVARMRARHIREYMTGYQSGDPAEALPHEPRPEYDPALVPSIEDREKTKADELANHDLKALRRSWRTWGDWRRDYERHGLWALVDRRGARLRNPIKNIPNDIRIAIQRCAAEYLTGDWSTSHWGVFRQRVHAYLDRVFADSGEEPPSLPSENTFIKWCRALIGDPMKKTARHRGTDENRPEAPSVNTVAVRPGQYVYLDATPFDVLCVSELDGRDWRPHLLAAVDFRTRRLWLRLCPSAPTSADVAALLASMHVPEQMRDGWDESLRHRYQFPFDWAYSVDERLEAAAALPMIWPETVVYDHGSEFKSVFIEACEHAGISAMPARPGTPTDKAAVEAVFPTVNKMLSAYLPGYVSIGVEHRGKKTRAALTFWELNELIAEWNVCVYQRHAHEGLGLYDMQGRKVSPNQAWAEAVAWCGFAVRPPNPYLYVEMLPTIFRTITSKGVRNVHMDYDDPVTVKWRDVESSPYLTAKYRGRKGTRQWPFKEDPNDLTALWFRDPDDGRWHRIPLKVPAGLELRPFGKTARDAALKQVKKLTGGTLNREQTEEALFVLLDRWHVGNTPAERRRVREIDTIRLQQAERDKAEMDAEDAIVLDLTKAIAVRTNAKHLVHALAAKTDAEVPADATDASDTDLADDTEGELTGTDSTPEAIQPRRWDPMNRKRRK